MFVLADKECIVQNGTGFDGKGPTGRGTAGTADKLHGMGDGEVEVSSKAPNGSQEKLSNDQRLWVELAARTTGGPAIGA